MTSKRKSITGKDLFRARSKAGLSLRRAARIAGVSHVSIWHWERRCNLDSLQFAPLTRLLSALKIYPQIAEIENRSQL